MEAPHSQRKNGTAGLPPKRELPVVFARRLLGGFGAGALLAASFPPYGMPFLLPLGIAALLSALQGVTPRQAAYVGLACGAVTFGGTLFWLGNLFGAAAISLCAIAAAFIALFAVLLVALRGRLPGVPAWLLAAVTWTAVEYYRSELFVLDFGWMGLGYGVAGVPALAAGASVVGSYGLTFGIVACGALLAGEFRDRRWRFRAAWLLAVWLLLSLVPVPAAEPSRPLAVRLVQAGSDDEDSLFRLSQPDPGRPFDLLVWPEYSFTSDPRREPRLWQRLEGVAQENRCYFVFGAKDAVDPADEAAFRNTAFVLDPEGRLAGRHVKSHTVHFVRDGVPGTEARAVPTSLGRLGVAICFDMDYPDVARRLVEDGAEVFLVPNMDPLEWGPVQRAQHRLMFQMRAAECGRWLARADVAGGTSAVAPTGGEVARVATSDPSRLDVRVGRETRRTLYIRGGWRVSQACLLALALLLLAAILRPKRLR